MTGGWPMSRMVPGMARGWSQTYTAGCRMGMRPQGIHMARFTTDLQLVLDEGIVWPGRIGRRMMRCTLEGTPTKWSATGRTITTGRRATGRTTTTLAIATAIGSSGS